MESNPLQLKSLNHISMLCSSIEESLDFYQNVLGFSSIRRPESFGFNGAWLFDYGIGIHLMITLKKLRKSTTINPKDNHISFQCESMAIVEKKLKEMGIKYVKARVTEGGIHDDQIFFHDPDGLMIEICNCENIPVIPLGQDSVQPCSRTSCNVNQQQQLVLQQQETVAHKPIIS